MPVNIKFDEQKLMLRFFLCPGFFDALKDVINPDDFTEVNQAILKAMHHIGDPIDVIRLVQALKELNLFHILQKWGGTDYLFNLIESL